VRPRGAAPTSTFTSPATCAARSLLRTIVGDDEQEATVYAVIATGGKQYRVEPGTELTVEKLTGQVDDTVELRPVMIVDDEGAVTVGPDIGDRSVTATITGHGRGEKLRVFTYKNKSRQHKRRGHRQEQTTIKIDSI
jgi:large subunit ribosomal protein L21